MTLKRQIRRASQRAFRKLLRRSGLESAGGGRRWEGASTLSSPQSSLAAARGPTKARAAGAYVNTPAGRQAVEAWSSALVGRGYQARSQHPDTAIAQSLNAEFEELTAPILLLVARCLVRDGEAFVRIVLRSDGRVALKALPVDQIDPALTRDLGGGAKIVSGVEFDADDEVVAYHVLPQAPDSAFISYLSPIRVPAQEILHVFDPLFPGQVRGVSWLSPVLLKIRDRDEASDALLMQSKTAALMTGFVSDPDGTGGGFEGDQDGSQLNVALEPGAMRVLPPGAQVSFTDPGSGVTQSAEFLRSIDREIAAGLGLTYEALTGDLTQTNYSSARVGLIEFRRRAEMLQKLLIEGKFLRPLWRRWIELKALAGDLGEAGPSLDDYMAVRFVAPGWAWVDPRNEVEAAKSAIEAGLKSREEVVAGRGRDIDELDAEIARDTQRPAMEATQ